MNPDALVRYSNEYYRTKESGKRSLLGATISLLAKGIEKPTRYVGRKSFNGLLNSPNRIRQLSGFLAGNGPSMLGVAGRAAWGTAKGTGKVLALGERIPAAILGRKAMYGGPLVVGGAAYGYDKLTDPRSDFGRHHLNNPLQSAKSIYQAVSNSGSSTASPRRLTPSSPGFTYDGGTDF